MQSPLFVVAIVLAVLGVLCPIGSSIATTFATHANPAIRRVAWAATAVFVLLACVVAVAGVFVQHAESASGAPPTTVVTVTAIPTESSAAPTGEVINVPEIPPAGKIQPASDTAPNASLLPIDETMQVPPSIDPNVQPKVPDGAALLGEPNLSTYCSQWNLRPVTRYADAWGLRCGKVDGLVGNRIGDQSISMTDACALTYPGQGSVDHYLDYSNSNSWGCYA